MFISKRSLRQGMTVFPTLMISLTFGMAYGWVSPAVEYFKSEEAEFEVSPEQLSWIASVFFAFEVISSVLNGVFTRRFGRKPMLQFAAFIHFLGWFLKVFASSPAMVILSRGLLGISGGTHDVVWCMYFGEVASPVERGVYGSFTSSFFLGGIMLEFLLSLWVPYMYLSIIPCAISAFTFFIKFFIKETPFYLLQKKKYDEAIRNLAWLRGKEDTAFVQAEFDEIKKFTEEEADKNYGLLHVARNFNQYKVAIVGVLIFTFAQPSGNIAILSFQTVLLDLFDETKPGADLTVIYGIVQFVFINFAPIVLETIGRKKPMIIGFCLTTVIQIALAYLFYVGEFQKDLKIPYLSYIICALFNIYGLIFVLTIFPTVYVLKCELFPQEIKSLANCSATMTNSLGDFIVVKLFVWVWLTFGLYMNFMIYAAICVLSVIYVAILIPETRGKTLIEIQEKIRKKSQASQVKKMSKTAPAQINGDGL